MFGRTTLLINRPDDIRRVLVDNDANYGRTRPTIRIIRPILGRGLFLAEGDDWRHQRRATAPGFTPKSTSLFATHAALAFMSALPGLGENDLGGVDLLGWFQELALNVAGRALFSLPMPTMGPHIRGLLDSYGRRFGQPGLLAMRLYPPAFVIVRQAKGPDRLAGREVPGGTVIMIAPWVLHRHRRLWDDADAFDPRRFLPETPTPNRFAYLPFGAGPRVCIGAPLAMAEAMLVTAALVGRFRLEAADDLPVLPMAVVTTQPDRRARFRLTPR